MPKFELLNLVTFNNPAAIVATDRNYIGPSFSFLDSGIYATFSIGKNKNLPNSQVTISFQYSTDAIAGAFSPNVVLILNNTFIGVRSFSSSNGSKTASINIDDTFLSILNTSVTEPNYDLLTLGFTIPGGTPSTTTTISDLSVSWITSKTEEFENYESFEGADVVTYPTYSSLPVTWEYNPVETQALNLSYRDNKYYKTTFSGLSNEPFDILSRAILRITGSNNLSISGVSETPMAIEAYCVNNNLSELTEEYNIGSETISQKGDIYAWGSSELISYSGSQSNDIELCFVKKNTAHSFDFSARKYGRDHKSLFADGDFYLKGLNSGYQITNIELILYEENDKYIPFCMNGGNTRLDTVIVTVPPSGYVSSRKLMKENLTLWRCTTSGSGVDPSGVEPSGVEPSGVEPSGAEPPPL